jgi:MinD-like ATPase involved in chromosome partitioning or flagellar assembly
MQATELGLPVFEYDPASRAARCFLELAREVTAKILEPSRLSTPASGVRSSGVKAKASSEASNL